MKIPIGTKKPIQSYKGKSLAEKAKNVPEEDIIYRNTEMELDIRKKLDLMTERSQRIMRAKMHLTKVNMYFDHYTEDELEKYLEGTLRRLDDIITLAELLVEERERRGVERKNGI